ncbi:Cof-type HAD-IIB family hydrolase [Chitinilyticum litopenaei]|uniref:Cof-type HAD-IIB family hydrolase n=1 Tax=Chitinilyticum litopenaei TaxID=1121276 RepID=UPI00041242E2|nr:Cof-type HAD-IIB family hydrolase [Chitinilyticum litopenaei]
MSPSPDPTIHPVQLDHRPDIRLIACDMDGTLLDDEHAIHDDFWPLIDELHRRGVLFCPASGRQYYSLLERFAPVADELVFIAENGSYVVQQGEELSSDCLALDDARALLREYRALHAQHADVNVVLCGKRSAYIEATDAAFRTEVDRYYPRLQVVDDLLAVSDDILKVALFTPRSSEALILPAFGAWRASHLVVVSGQHWLDIMAPGVNKGSGIRHIQQLRGITREQTMVFGDFLNDLEMMDEAAYSFAMANAHPLLKERANYLAPGNTDNGVVRTIKAVLGLD